MVTFMSKAAASFIMTDGVARSVIEASGSDWSDEGIWRVERLSEVRMALEQRAEQSRAQEGPDVTASGAVAFYQRLAPVLEMLRKAEAKQKPVVWARG
ncbi:MAG: hypothetical protein RLY30_664 [Pseudomonadota bacterium]|jgi:hypothetical protein